MKGFGFWRSSCSVDVRSLYVLPSHSSRTPTSRNLAGSGREIEDESEKEGSGNERFPPHGALQYKAVCE